jgi:hypothetical protein
VAVLIQHILEAGPGAAPVVSERALAHQICQLVLLTADGSSCQMEPGQGSPLLPPHPLPLDTQDLLVLVCLALAILGHEKKDPAPMDQKLPDMDLTHIDPQDQDPQDLSMLEHLNLQDNQEALVPFPVVEGGTVLMF